MTIMVDIVNNNEVTDKDIEDLNLVAKMYKGTLEDTLSISVPKEFAKEHLDLINVYNALYHDVLGLTELINDPVKALIRVKRYQDDVVGLTIAMENMYRALDKAAYVFQTSDNATLFANFAPNISKP